MQQDGFSHSDLYRRACRAHERKLRAAVGVAVGAATGQTDVAAAAEGLFEACIAAIPYAPARAFLASEQAKLAASPYAGALRSRGPLRDDGERPRVAILADGIGSTHGVTRTIEEIRLLVRAGSLLPTQTLRLDLHPADLRHARARDGARVGPHTDRLATHGRHLRGARGLGLGSWLSGVCRR
jgi:hypothetical protein